MVLRNASVEDAPTLLRLMHAAFEEYRGMLAPPTGAHDETIDSVRRRLAEGSAVLALVAREAAGCAFYQRVKDFVYFSRLSVVPAYRNRGIGTALLEYVEQRAREQGVGSVRLGVRLQLPHLVRRYEKLGYRVIEQVTHEGFDKPTYVMMEKHV